MSHRHRRFWKGKLTINRLKRALEHKISERLGEQMKIEIVHCPT
jgi:hypothetical protein